MRADRTQRSKQGEIVEAGVADGREQCGAPAVTEGGADEVTVREQLLGRPVIGPVPPEGLVEQPLDRATCELERHVARERRRSDGEEQDEHCDAEVRGRREAVADGRAAEIAGSASTGSASVVAICSPVEAAKAAAASPVSTPARRSIVAEKAVAVAPPPGRIRPTALPLSWAAATGNQARVWSAIRSSSQRQT